MRWLLLLLSVPALAANYYVSAYGSDSNDGTSTATPWQTVSKVNSGTYIPGDTISFHGGDIFSGTTLSPTLVGSPGNLITLTSYGTGQGTLAVGSCSSPAVIHGISLTNPQFVTITDLQIVGAGWTGSGLGEVVCGGGYGIFIRSTTTSGTQLPGITITNNSISGFWLGTMISSDGASTVGFNGVLYSGNTLTHNLSGGIWLLGYKPDAGGPVDQFAYVTISNNLITDMPGDPNSGSGGVHGSVQTEAGGINVGNITGLVIGCSTPPPWATPCGNYVSGVGGYGGALTGLAFGGTPGIAATNSSNVQINGNEVSYTRCSTKFDASAIDFDQDVTTGEAAYNLCYNNVGPCVQWGSFGGFTTSGISVHHNISYNDARGNNAHGTSEQGVFRIWGSTDNSKVFENTVYLDGTGALGQPSVINFEVGPNTNLVVANNVFVTTGGVPFFWANRINNATHMGSPVVDGNIYDSSGGSLLISNDNGGKAVNITTLSAWRSLGFEVHGGTTYGSTRSAQLRNVAVFLPPPTGFMAIGTSISAVENFDLGPTSAATGEGIDPSVLKVSLGSADYHGHPAARGSSFDAGAVSFLAIPSSGVSGEAAVRQKTEPR